MHFCQFEVFIDFFFVFILCLSFVWSFFHVISIPDIRLDGLWLAMTYRDGNVRWEFIASTFVAEESMYALWLWFFFGFSQEIEKKCYSARIDVCRIPFHWQKFDAKIKNISAYWIETVASVQFIKSWSAYANRGTLCNTFLFACKKINNEAAAVVMLCEAW